MTSNSPRGSAHVQTHVDGALGVITLARPAALNALNAEMIHGMHDALTTWANDDSVAAVWVQGGDRGLCAGGDVRAVREVALSGDADRAMSFFTAEYALNQLIGDFPKPYVAWMDGIVMGGGLGISAHGSHRLVTERTKIAMPETIIGFFPDVGALWLLARAPGELGVYLALTGVTIGGSDAASAGLADCVVSSSAKDQVYAELLEAARTLPAEELVDWAPSAEHLVEGKSGDLVEHRGWIDECYAGVDLAAMVEKLGASAEPAAGRAVELMEQRSPFSVAITVEAIRRAADMSLNEVLAQDAVLARAFIAHPDFAEGVRAQLVDKDRSPQWATKHLSDIDPIDILAAFDPAS